jgi:hypothetical protein
MTRYERAFGTDWESLDPDSATDRAYAIGVAELLGEDNHEELQAIYDEMGSAYKRSIVELAYEEGQTEARETNAEDGSIWSELVTGEVEEAAADIDPEHSGPPELLDTDALLDRADIDSTDAVDRPDFLER